MKTRITLMVSAQEPIGHVMIMAASKYKSLNPELPRYSEVYVELASAKVTWETELIVYELNVQHEE